MVEDIWMTASSRMRLRKTRFYVSIRDMTSLPGCGDVMCDHDVPFEDILLFWFSLCSSLRGGVETLLDPCMKYPMGLVVY